eukprot:3418397-Prymnesium_polylepis.1
MGLQFLPPSPHAASSAWIWILPDPGFSLACACAWRLCEERTAHSEPRARSWPFHDGFRRKQPHTAIVNRNSVP